MLMAVHCHVLTMNSTVLFIPAPSTLSKQSSLSEAPHSLYAMNYEHPARIVTKLYFKQLLYLKVVSGWGHLL